MVLCMANWQSQLAQDSRFAVSRFGGSGFCGLAFSVSWFRVFTFFGFWFAFIESGFCVSTFSRLGFTESRFCVSTFSRSRFAGLVFAESGFCAATFSGSGFCGLAFSVSGFCGSASTESGFCVSTFFVLGLLDWHLSNPSFAFSHFAHGLMSGDLAQPNRLRDWLRQSHFAAFPFFRFARTTVVTIPATRITPPAIANGKTREPLFLFSGFAKSGFSVSTFSSSRFTESWFCVPTFSSLRFSESRFSQITIPPNSSFAFLRFLVPDLSVLGFA